MYSFYNLVRDLTVSNGRTRVAGTIVFSENPPQAEGFYDVPRQSVKLQEMETGVTNLDYGPDPGNQTVRLSFQSIPEFVMQLWEAEYLDESNNDGVYTLTDHRGRSVKVKWKAFTPAMMGTLDQSDVTYWLDRYRTLYTLDDSDPYYGQLADIYKVVMEFFVVPAPLSL